MALGNSENHCDSNGAGGCTADPRPHSRGDVTTLLVRWSEGDESALNELMPLVYGELRKNARHHLAQESAHHSLVTGEMINEVYMRLVRRHTTRWQNRKEFFAFAGGLMRRILVDHARAKATAKRGKGLERHNLPELALLADPQPVDMDTILAVDSALTRLEAGYPLIARQVELRYFAGLTVEETSEALEISRATFFRRWEFARRWLARELESPTS